ncbi:hypothetical protein BpHYR1_028895 [Brachionus plicatilis]|uniref:Uncharacterized protein n=1 Tax=Brachionus plicatilis TaxID=10195 RepID=A0A3M7RZM8_BRAPC|nr:hypothetical protein BpHYR1_028895 [Brachionus plicatilis]
MISAVNFSSKFFGSCPECDQLFTKKCDHRKGSFFKEIALVPVESFDAAKLAAKKALSKQSKSVESSNCGEFMKNEKEPFLINM